MTTLLSGAGPLPSVRPSSGAKKDTTTEPKSDAPGFSKMLGSMVDAEAAGAPQEKSKLDADNEVLQPSMQSSSVMPDMAATPQALFAIPVLIPTAAGGSGSVDTASDTELDGTVASMPADQRDLSTPSKSNPLAALRSPTIAAEGQIGGPAPAVAGQIGHGGLQAPASIGTPRSLATTEEPALAPATLPPSGLPLATTSAAIDGARPGALARTIALPQVDDNPTAATAAASAVQLDASAAGAKQPAKAAASRISLKADVLDTSTPSTLNPLLPLTTAIRMTGDETESRGQHSENPRLATPLEPLLSPATAHAATESNPFTVLTDNSVYKAHMLSRPHEAGFGGDLAAQVKLMMASESQHAELHLNPAELGPIRIQLHLLAQTADISFSANHAATRESIMQALPALREMLAEQGLNLGQAGLSSGQGDNPFQKPQPPSPAPLHTGTLGTNSLAIPVADNADTVVRGKVARMLDMYA